MKSESNTLSRSLTRVAGFFWAASFLVLLVAFVIATNGLREPLASTSLGKSSHFPIILILGFGMGIISAPITILTLLYREFVRTGFLRASTGSIESRMRQAVACIGLCLTFPVVVLMKLWGLTWGVPEAGSLITYASIGKTALSYGVIFFFIVPLWIGVYSFIAGLTTSTLGLVKEPIPLTGTGSMYPTFPKGQGKDPKKLAKQIVGTPGMFPYPSGLSIFGTRYFSHTIDRGDIVVADNQTIRAISQKLHGKETGIVKRVIALPGDEVEVRGGILFVNGEPRKEPYVARARSTFGGTFLEECKAITIPEGKLFLMGDNRTVSSDSRYEIGPVSYDDIHFVLPWQKQLGTVDQNWHDPTDDLNENKKITIDPEHFVRLLNTARRNAGIRELRYESRLKTSANLRGTAIIKHNDFSFEATRSGYTMKQAMKDAGYSNIVYGEWAFPGYYEAEELIDRLLEFGDGKQFLFDTRYQDIGISEASGFLNNCPTQVVVLHLAGYVPPNYSREVVNSWRQALVNLRQIQPGWQKLTDNERFYEDHKADIDRINTIINTRITNIDGIAAKFTANQWLTDDEEAYLARDETLATEQDAIANKLNSL